MASEELEAIAQLLRQEAAREREESELEYGD